MNDTVVLLIIALFVYSLVILEPVIKKPRFKSISDCTEEEFEEEHAKLFGTG